METIVMGKITNSCHTINSSCHSPQDREDYHLDNGNTVIRRIWGRFLSGFRSCFFLKCALAQLFLSSQLCLHIRLLDYCSPSQSQSQLEPLFTQLIESELEIFTSWATNYAIRVPTRGVEEKGSHVIFLFLKRVLNFEVDQFSTGIASLFSNLEILKFMILVTRVIRVIRVIQVGCW